MNSKQFKEYMNAKEISRLSYCVLVFVCLFACFVYLQQRQDWVACRHDLDRMNKTCDIEECYNQYMMVTPTLVR